MNEAKFNTVIRNSIIQHNGYAYKISDVGGGKQQRRPFDGFGVYYDGLPLYWEAKRMKGLQSFNVKEIFEGSRGHQLETMQSMKDLLNVKAHFWVILLCYIPRNSRVYTFTYEALQWWYNTHEDAGIKKNILEKLPHTEINKQLINSFHLITDEELEITEETV